MADFTMKQNDTWPPLPATLQDANGPINLTTATSVRLILVPTGGGAAIVDDPVTIVSAAAGTVRYTWVTGDTATIGTFKGEFEITWNDGKIGTVPNEGYFVVEILDDLA
jgi:hypothetical protein